MGTYFPDEGSTHKYEIELDKTTGKWTYSFDDVVWTTLPPDVVPPYHFDDFWVGKTGETADYSGEIFNKQDDMPGTIENPCNFTGCQFNLDLGAYQPAGLIATDVKSDDDNEWGANFVSGTALNIYDKHPN